jgi:hypothetical protein
MLKLNTRRRVVSASEQHASEAQGTSRRSFLRSSSGVIAIAAVPAAAIAAPSAEAAAGAATPVANPATPAPSQPVMAYVHDAKHGIVVIMSGTTERTVRDRELVRRLLTKPKAKAKRKHRKLPKPAQTRTG